MRFGPAAGLGFALLGEADCVLDAAGFLAAAFFGAAFLTGFFTGLFPALIAGLRALLAADFFVDFGFLDVAFFAFCGLTMIFDSRANH